jgi:S-layer homology domain/GDSL-like Lipase/Acylhydrolase family
VVENGGVIGSFSSNGIDNINNWLSIFPGKYVCIAYGTNDAWGKQIGEDYYYNYIKGMVKAVLDAGKIPVIPKIPWAKLPAVRDNVPLYNEKIEKLYQEFPQIIKGPDLWTFFYENQHYISDDPDDYVHPTVDGYNAMRQAWADTMLDRVYVDSFGDMANHWAKDTVEYMAERNYIKGRSKNVFCPDESITRAEFAALVVNTLKINKESSINAFRDVPDSAWFRSPVNKAYGAKVISGVGNECFNPNDKITREQMVVMLINAYYRVMKQSSDGIENIKDAAFNDEKGISDWARLSVKIATNKGICKGFPDGTFRPQQSTTRAQAAVAMKLLLEKSK